MVWVERDFKDHLVPMLPLHVGLPNTKSGVSLDCLDTSLISLEKHQHFTKQREEWNSLLWISSPRKCKRRRLVVTNMDLPRRNHA